MASDAQLNSTCCEQQPCDVVVASAMKRQSDAQPGGDDEPTSKSMKTMSDTGGVGLDDDNEFAGLRGQLLVEAIFKKWGAGTMTIPWLNTETKERNIRRDGVNRPIMESLAEAYADRILSSGPNADRSGLVKFLVGLVIFQLE